MNPHGATPSASEPRPRYGTPAEIADYLHTTPGSLASDRYLGRGLPYVKFGRKVLYEWAAVDAYLAQHVVTAEPVHA